MNLESVEWALDDSTLTAEFNQLLVGLSLQGRKALFDLIGGIVHLSWSSSQFDELARARPDSMTFDQSQMLEALIHERLHFVQTCTFGFMYTLAIDLFSAAVGLLSPATNRTFQQPEQLPAEARKHLHFVQERLASVSDDGLTTLDIIESVTHYHQIVIRYDLTSERYVEQLDISERDPFQAILDAIQAPHEYRAAYDAAVRYCGSEAFFIFPRAAGLSLCTRRPERAFRSICEQLRALDRKEADRINLIGWIGTAFELSSINNSRGRTHPIYTEAIEHQGQDAFRTLLQTGPDELSRRLQLMSVPMLCYDPPSPRPFLRGDEEVWPDLGRDERLAASSDLCRNLGFGSSVVRCGQVKLKRAILASTHGQVLHRLYTRPSTSLTQIDKLAKHLEPEVRAPGDGQRGYSDAGQVRFIWYATTPGLGRHAGPGRLGTGNGQLDAIQSLANRFFFRLALPNHTSGAIHKFGPHRLAAPDRPSHGDRVEIPKVRHERSHEQQVQLAPPFESPRRPIH